MDRQELALYWHHAKVGWLDADHPGVGHNVIGLYGDDCRYNSGEKLISITWNAVLEESTSDLSLVFKIYI